MRRLAVLALLGACATHHVRVRVVDATTGDPIGRADLGLRIQTRATRDSGWCRHGDSWFAGAAREPDRVDTGVSYRHALTDDLGETRLAIPRRRGFCRHEPSRVEVLYRDRSIGYVDPEADDVVIPVFNPTRSDPDLASSPFTRDRLATVFSKPEAVRSVAYERVMGWVGRAPEELATLVPSDDGDGYLVRPYGWTADPWAPLVQASIRRNGDWWHVELRRLAATLGADGLPRLPPPAGFTSAAARDALHTWAAERRDVALWRAVIETELLHADSSFVSETPVGKVDRTWEVRIASAGPPLTAFAIAYAATRLSIVRVAAGFASEAGSARVAKLEPLELQTMDESIGACDDASEHANGGPRAFSTIVQYLRANGGRVEPGIEACTPSRAGTAEGCAVGIDREGHPWRARCWHGDVHDHPLFEIDRRVHRMRAWRAD